MVSWGMRENDGRGRKKESARTAVLDSLSSAMLGRLFVTVLRVGTLALE